MQLAGRRALAQAYQGVAIDPATGLPDSNQLVRNLQNTPGGGLVLPEVIPALQKQQQGVYALNKAALDQATARTNTVNTALAPLMRKGANVTPQDVMTTIAGLHASGFPTDEFVQDAATTLPVKAPGMSDAAYGQQLQGWIVNHAARAWPAATQANAFTPTVGTVDTGGNIVTRDVNPLTNSGITSAAPIGKTFTPGEQAAQVPGPVGPQGQRTVLPQSTYVTQNGMGNLLPGGAPGQPAGSPFANGGRLPPALLNPGRAGTAQPSAPVGSIGAGSPGYAPAAPSSAASGGALAPVAQAASAAAPPAPNPGVPMVVGMGPGQAAGATAAGDASAKAWAQLQSSVGGSAGRIYQLQSALGDLQALGPTGTGPSAGTLNNVRSYLQSLPVVGQSLGVDPSKVASYDEANKYLTAYAAARAGRFGGGTDQQLATTLSSNASTHISNLAAQDVVKANIGLERMDQAQLAGFQQGLDPLTGQPTGQQFTPDQFADYSSKWNTAHDARAFVADHLNPQQFSTMLSGMSPADQVRFSATLNNGIAQGYINPPSWMQPQQPSASAPAAAPAATPSPAISPTVPAAAPPASATPAPATTTQAAATMPLSLTGNGLPAILGGY